MENERDPVFHSLRHYVYLWVLRYNTQTINSNGPVLATAQEKATKSCFKEGAVL